ncbi:hypothetical protein SAMN04487995_2317 [Dyadobacter koreensis]|uniref:Uncharacterized protein n=1 Tax=Dyadobacter koreensis TaxID=408657 RepID=A0A1H6TLZ8_9BACT|nr:hypothetical protein SAMN04487995_2317 [Dyadobacter koreensis]
MCIRFTNLNSYTLKPDVFEHMTKNMVRVRTLFLKITCLVIDYK